MTDLRCWDCGESLAGLPRPITRHMNCPACFEDLHCCRMCRHFTDNATAPCADERAEPPVNKEGANFCDFFRPAPHSYRVGRRERKFQAKSHLDALFGRPGQPATPDDAAADSDGAALDPIAAAEEEARRKLDALFK